MKTKKRSAVGKFVKHLAYKKKRAKASKRKRKNPEGGIGETLSSFTDEMKDTGMELLPVLGSTAGSTVLVRLFDKFARKFDKSGTGIISKHAAALAWVGVLLTVYLTTTKVKSLRRYRHSALLGTAIGAVIHLLPKYLPQLGWIVGQPLPPPAPQVSLPLPDDDERDSAGVDAAALLTDGAGSLGGSDLTLLQGDDDDDLAWNADNSGDYLDRDDRELKKDLKGGIFA